MSSKEKVRRHREKLRQQGLRPVQFWLPDVNSPEFIAEAHRQSLLAANSPHAKEDQDFVDAISWLNSDEADSSWVYPDLE
ncbi:MAG: antitoxin MazE family protein [Chloroflexota bacterium]